MNHAKVSRTVHGALTVWLCIAALGCSSDVKKADLESKDPTAEVARLEQDVNKGLENQDDVIAAEPFTRAQKELERAKRELADNDKPERIMDTLGYARAHLMKANERAEAVRNSAAEILEARSAALNAGVRSFPDLGADLKQQDDELRSQADHLNGTRTSSQQWAELQKGYLDLELRSIENAKLSQARSKIRSAIAGGARKNCPKMLNQAERDLLAAENVITANRHDNATIQPAIDTANASAALLGDILAATKRNEGVISEDAAKDLVMQARKLSRMGEELTETKSQASGQTAELARQHDKIKAEGAKLSLDEALEGARKKFSPEEAEVFRQGDKLLIRLKAVQFPSGRSDLPADSLPLLAKVKTVAEDLNPQQIVVEGHTDSTGKSQTNKALSQDRAEAVASYLANNGLDKDKIDARGFGFEKPIVSNKTKKGRAQNRRVDVIITPAQAEGVSSSL